MSVYEMAKMYYPRLWDKSRLEALVEAGRLTVEEAAQVMGERIQEEEGDGNESELLAERH